MIKVSVLIPIYNVEKYLRQCLESVINQTLQDIEIICINDGSTDSSLEIINEYAARDDRIKVINKKNTGYGHSMNCGLKLAQGEYIGIVESDDFADPDMFETLYNKTQKNGADIVKSNYWAQIGSKKLFIESLKGEIYEKTFSPKESNRTLFQHQIVIWSAIYKREFLLKNDIYFNETSGASYQDISFLFKTMACADSVHFMKEAFLHYRIDNPNSSIKSKAKAFCVFDEAEESERFLEIHSEIPDSFKYALVYLIFKQCEIHYSYLYDSFKLDFFQKMAAKFEKYKSMGYLDESYWETENWNLLQDMLEDKIHCFYSWQEKIQKKSCYAQGFFEKIRTYNKIYLYGAGKLAAFMMFSLFQRGIRVTGIVVSDMKDNPSEFMGVPVISFENLNIDKKQDLILISIKDDIQSEIFYKLKSAGYDHVMLMIKKLISMWR